MKKTVFTLYLIILIVLASATLVEHFVGTARTHELIYGSWWFTLLWAMLVVAGLALLVRRYRKRRLTFTAVNTVAIHLAFVIILVGALVTHLTARQGIIHLRGDQPTHQMMVMDGADEEHAETLPFYVRLDQFHVSYHPGTTSPADYATHFSILNGPQTLHATVSMNHIYTFHHYRLYQASYDTDHLGSYLSVNHDPWGIGITYTGYALLFISLLALLLNPHGTFRQLLRSDLLRKTSLVLLTIFSLGQTLPVRAESAVSAPVVSRELASEMGQLYIHYHGRICPLQTFAKDFVTKLHGNSRYCGLDAEQVLTSWMFWPDAWFNEPIIHLKGKQLRQKLHLPEHTSVHAFFPEGSYVLGPLVQEYQEGHRDALHKAAFDMDGRLQLVMELRRGSSLAIFPHTENNVTRWYSPADELPKDMSPMEQTFVRNVFHVIEQTVTEGKTEQAGLMLTKLRTYQQRNAGQSLPTETQWKAELLYNRWPIASILFMFNLFMGLVLLHVLIKTTNDPLGRFHHIPYRWCVGLSRGLLLLALLSLTFCLVLRGIISDSLPLSNGYDTMLLMAWLVMLSMLVASFAFRALRLLTCSFGFLLSGFFLLVSHINAMDPAIGPIMPVLNSPLLSVHVSIIMIGFALLALTFACSVTGLLVRNREQMMLLFSRLLLYPAVVALSLGIFIGAVWANISWGNYWTWDPKETWALISLMVYAIPLHASMVKSLQRPRTFHKFMVAAFLTLIMTYFGVNYFLEGMHSYA